MKQNYIIAANWKMNKTIEESEHYINQFKNLLLDIPIPKVIFCPPFLSLYYMKELLSDSPVYLGAQNLHWEDSGAYTGEISAGMIKSAGISHVIIGHSERRQLFGETDHTVNLKIQKALASGLIPIMCIGETLEERRQNDTLAVLETQLTRGLENIVKEDLYKIIFAYEPIWAIGTGERAEPEQISEAHRVIKDFIKTKEVVGDISVLYGGSVKSSNVDDLLQIDEVNGFLIGGSSLIPDEFALIIQKTEKFIKKGKLK